MTTPLPARPQGIRTSPDGLTVAVLYDSLEHGPRWCAMSVREHGLWIRQVDFLAAEDVEGWVEWSPPPMVLPSRTLKSYWPETEVT